MPAGRDRSLTWTAPLLVAMVVTLALGAGVGEAGTRMIVRATARTSALVLCLAGAVWPRHPAVEWGLLWVAVSFLFAYAPRAARSPWLYGPAVGALLLAVVLRIAGAFIRRAPLQEDVAA